LLLRRWRYAQAFGMIPGHAVIRVFVEEARDVGERHGWIFVLDESIDLIPAPAKCELCGAGALSRATQFVDGDLLCKSLRFDPVYAAKQKAGFDATPTRCARQDLRAIFFVQPFEPCGKIDGRAERGIVHTVGRADIADHGIADMQAESRRVRRPALA